MSFVSQAIEQYIRDVIRIPRADSSTAANSRDWLVTRVLNAIENDSGGLNLHDSPVLRYGSYFKGTQVATVDEFDLLLAFEGINGWFVRGGQQVATGIGSTTPNPIFGARFTRDDGCVSPVKMLNWLKGIIEGVVTPYGGDAPERNGQAVVATIKSNDLKIDFVPAVVLERDSDRQTIYAIPDGRRSGGWTLTTPHLDMQRIRTTAANRQNFRNAIRIAKRIKNQYNFQVRSYAVEVSALEYTTVNTWTGDLNTDLTGVLLALCEGMMSSSLFDPDDPSQNLLDNCTSQQLNWYAGRVLEIVKTMKACEAETDYGRVYQRIHKAFENG